MQSLKFKQLLILSHSARSANRFKFGPRLNLITATENSVGKSNLVKLLLWGLGCQPVFDDTWKTLDARTIITFSIGRKNYTVSRYKNGITLQSGGSTVEEYEKITGPYSARFAEIVGFSPVLPNRSTGAPETPPPAFYFLPYYIDQKRSWTVAWDNFEGLQQYENWRSTIIQTHVGQIPPEYFKLTSAIHEESIRSQTVKVGIDKFRVAIEVLDTQIQNAAATLDPEYLERMSAELKEELVLLATQEESILSELSLLESEAAYLTQQQQISKSIIMDLDKDYAFSIESLPDEEIECPLCGVRHENNLYNRTSILTDKQAAENQLKSIEKSLSSITSRISSSREKLAGVKQQITILNNRFAASQPNSEGPAFGEVIRSFAANSIRHSLTGFQNEQIGQLDQVNTSLQQLRSQQKDVLDKGRNVEIDDAFSKTLTRFVKHLQAEAVNLSLINKPTDYVKIVKEGGAAEGTRAILAYYLTIYSLISRYGYEVLSPMIIDTPNQQEQSLKNYAKIVELILTDLPKSAQIIISAM